jgi:hypothetical protein
MESKFQRLQREITHRSRSDTWDLARGEWVLEYVEYGPESNCICGHPIVERCHLKNIHTKESVVVGNVCVKQFSEELHDLTRKAIDAYKRILEHPSTRKANEDLIDLAFFLKWINDYEEDFYRANWRKRILTEAQNNLVKQINLKIINNMNRSKKPTCSSCSQVYLNQSRKTLLQM